MDAVTGCPDDYAELFTLYFPMMRTIVGRSGIAVEDVEDVAMEILTKFIEKDGIAYYDPEYLLDTGENPEVEGPRMRKPKFKGMLRGFTSTYVLQYRDKQQARHIREPYRLESPTNWSRGGASEERQISWLEWDNLVEPIAEWEFRSAVGSSLSQTFETLAPMTTEFRDYPTFCNVFVTQCDDDGDPPRRALCSELGVSGSTLRSMITDFRTTLSAAIVTGDVYA